MTTHNETQFLLAMARAALWTATVQSGAYKLSRTEISCGRNADGTIKFRTQTDDEKLLGAVATAWRHLAIAAEFAEHLPVIPALQSKNENGQDHRIRDFKEY